MTAEEISQTNNNALDFRLMHDRSPDPCIITQKFIMDHLLGIFDNGTDKTMPESLPPEVRMPDLLCCCCCVKGIFD